MKVILTAHKDKNNVGVGGAGCGEAIQGNMRDN
jgi:hypothetical protein